MQQKENWLPLSTKIHLLCHLILVLFAILAKELRPIQIHFFYSKRVGKICVNIIQFIKQDLNTNTK